MMRPASNFPAATAGMISSNGTTSYVSASFWPIDSKSSQDGQALYVEGSVRNVGTLTSSTVSVRVDGIDADGRSRARAEAFPAPQVIPPGGSGRFVVRLPNDAAIRSFHVEAVGK